MLKGFRQWILHSDIGELVFIYPSSVEKTDIPKDLEPILAPNSLQGLLSPGREQIQTLLDIYNEALGAGMLHPPSIAEMRAVVSQIEAAVQSGRLLLYRRKPLLGSWIGNPRRLPVKAAARMAVPTKVEEWIEIVLVGEDGKGVANEKYLIVGSDSKEYKGVTDSEGLARLDSIEEGTYQASFPDLHEDAWERG